MASERLVPRKDGPPEGARLIKPLLTVCLAGFSLLLLAGCQANKQSRPVGRIEHVGILAGFPRGKEAGPGRRLFFEPSALIRSDNQILIANDKPIPGFSPVLSVPINEFRKDYIDSSAVTFVMADAFKNSSKLESFAASARWCFAATDFDRIADGSPQDDTYNNLIAWPTGQPELARIVCPSERAGVVSSRELRVALANALRSARYPDGPPYFKIEGLTSPNPQSLIFGVREIGTNYEHQDYCFILLETTINGGTTNGVTVDSNFRRLLDFQPVIPEMPGIKLGLSALEYDPDLQVFVAMTSREQGESLGACLWVFTALDLANCKSPRLVRDTSGKPLFLTHKGEGLVSLGEHKFLIICDEDQFLKPVQTNQGVRTREPQEAPFYTIRIDFEK
jgi:hypothetical protein